MDIREDGIAQINEYISTIFEILAEPLEHFMHLLEIASRH